MTWEIQIGKYKPRNTNRRILIGKVQTGTIQFRKYTWGKYKSEIQIGNYKLEKYTSANDNPRIKIGKYKSEKYNSREHKSGNTNRENTI